MPGSVASSNRRWRLALPIALAAATPLGAADLDGRLLLLAREDARVAAVFERIATAALPLCRRRVARTGLLLHDLAQYAPAARPAAARLFGLEPGSVGVATVVPGSAAAVAGMVAGDRLLAIDGAAAPASAAEMRFRLAAAPVGARLALRIARDGHAYDRVLHPVEGCDLRVSVVPDRALDARAADDRVRITTALVEATLGDDELAFLLGHEVAHLVEADTSAGPGRRRERAADALGLRLAAAAGYAPAVAAPLILRLARARGLRLDTGHPAAGDRAQALALLARTLEASATRP